MPPRETLPLKEPDAAVTEPTVMFGVPVSPPAVPEVLPVTSPVTSPVKLPTKVVAVATPVITTPPGFACALTFPPLSFSAVASIPVKLDPSPSKELAVTMPDTFKLVKLP